MVFTIALDSRNVDVNVVEPRVITVVCGMTIIEVVRMARAVDVMLLLWLGFELSSHGISFDPSIAGVPYTHAGLSVGAEVSPTAVKPRSVDWSVEPLLLEGAAPPAEDEVSSVSVLSTRDENMSLLVVGAGT